jgi:nitrite reductase (NADH) small subunit
MVQWVRVASLDDCPPGTAGEWVVDGQLLAWFNVDGEICALDGICPHQGGPLGRGRLDGSVVTCPWHGWQFDVRTGRHQVNPSLHHPQYRVKVEGSDIFVQLDDSRSEADH